MANLRKLSNQEKDRTTIQRSGRTLNFFGDSSGRRTTVKAASIFCLTASIRFWPYVSTICQSLFQPREASIHRVDDGMCLHPIVNICLMNHSSYRKSKCIKHNTFLASFDFLVPAYVTAGVGVVGRIDTSGINDSDAGRSLPPINLQTMKWRVSTNSPKTPSNFPLLSSRRRCCGAESS